MKEYQIGFSDEFSYGDTLIKYEVSEGDKLFDVSYVKDCISKALRLKLLNIFENILRDVFKIYQNNISNSQMIEYQLLLWSLKNKYSYIDNVVLLPMCRWLYINGYTNNLLASKTWFTTGLQHGTNFEKLVLEVVKDIGFDIKKIDKTDGIIYYNDMKIILEIKNNKTDTDGQLNTYMSQQKTDYAITINGTHTQNIRFDACIDIWRLTEVFFKIFEFNIKINRESNINKQMDNIYKKYLMEGIIDV